MTKAKVENIAEGLGWSVRFQTQKNSRGETEKYVEFSQDSPAGEDFSFYVFYGKLPEIPTEVYRYWQGFDIEEHVKMWLEAKSNGVRGVPDVVTLVDDAQEIETMLENLWEELKEGA